MQLALQMDRRNKITLACFFVIGFIVTIQPMIVHTLAMLQVGAIDVGWVTPLLSVVTSVVAIAGVIFSTRSGLAALKDQHAMQVQQLKEQLANVNEIVQKLASVVADQTTNSKLSEQRFIQLEKALNESQSEIRSNRRRVHELCNYLMAAAADAQDPDQLRRITQDS